MLGVAAGPPKAAARTVSPMPIAGSGRTWAGTGVTSVIEAGANVAITDEAKVEVDGPLAAPRESDFGTRRSIEPAAEVDELVVPAGDEAAADGPEETDAVLATEGPPSAWLIKAAPMA